MVEMEEWDICPQNWKKNYKVILKSCGLWRLEDVPTWGKWLCIFEKINESPNCPTNADQRNFISGLLECENRNDKFRVSHNSRPQLKESIRKFQEVLDRYKQVSNDEEKIIDFSELDEVFKNGERQTKII